MLDINIGNFLTVGIISVAFYAAMQWVLSMTGLSIPFLNA